MEPNQPSTIAPYTCGGCDHRWSGVSRCHCSAVVYTDVEFAAADPKKVRAMTAKFPALQPIGDALHLLAALVHDPFAVPVRRHRFAGPDAALTQQSAVTVGGFTQLSWGRLAGLTGAGPAVTAADLRLDAPAGSPSARVVAVVLGDRTFYLRSTLPRTRCPHAPADPGQGFTLRLRAGWHRTFTGEAGFALHLVGGEGCQDPATLVFKETSTKAGSRMLFLNNGLWGSEEHPAGPGAAFRAIRDRQDGSQSRDLVDA